MKALTCRTRYSRLVNAKAFVAAIGIISLTMLITTPLAADDVPPRKNVPPKTAPSAQSPAKSSATSKPANAAATKSATSKPASKSSQPANVARKKSAGPRWTAAVQSSEKSRIDFITANSPAPDESKTSTESADAGSTEDPASSTSEADDPAENASLDLAEQFRKVLEKRRLERGEVNTEQPDDVGNKSATRNSTEATGMDILGLSPQTARDLESYDPVKREKARRFFRLKVQLLELKSKIQAADANSPPAEPSAIEPHTSSPSATDESAESHTIDHEPLSPSASDHASEHHTAPETNPAELQTPHGDDHAPIEHHDIHSDDHSAPHHPPATDDHKSDPLTSPVHSNHPPTDNSHAEDVHDAHSSNPAAAEHESHGVRPLSQTPIVDGAIDRLGLANNLYAIGDYLIAREMYEHEDMAELTAQQQIWAEYQIANCLRRMGQKAEASNRYRRIAAQPESGWLSEQAAWWVDVLEQTRQLEKALHEETTPSSKPVPKSKEPKNGKHSR